MKAFNVRMFKPDIAPADVPVETPATTINNPLFGDFGKAKK